MKKSRPPFIAAWLLDRFGADPQLDAIAGDLIEEYRLGRSRFWYWREVITAMIAGVWAGFRDHTMVVLRAFAIGSVLTYVTVWIIGPFEASLIAPYIALVVPRLYESGIVMGMLIGGPWCCLTGWIVARFAYRCRIPAVVGFAMSFLLLGLIGNCLWMITQGNDPRFVWLSLFGLLLLTILILFGGGLLTGPPKRSMPGSGPLERESTTS